MCRDLLWTMGFTLVCTKRAKANGMGKAQFLAAQLLLLAEPELALDKAGM